MSISKHLYTVDEVAKRVNLHVKTIRRHIHEGRLKAKRVGKEYRITRADLAEFAGDTRESHEPIPRTRQVIVSSIVDVDAISSDESHRITTMVMAALNARKGESDHPRVDSIYYSDHARLRITITANLELTSAVLRVIHVVLEEGRGRDL